jgi:Pyruvate/2-oxoacid:ferredoxin oxidoreductase gamma subunit
MGLKLGNPDLNVITLIGDGACGIGGNHIVNAARRNIGITLIVCNNLNYGMTGGQLSVTTPSDSVTITSPEGNIEAPLDVCALGVAGEAGWVGRVAGTKGNINKLVDRLTSAINYDGFALIDVWETCPGRFQKFNDINDSNLKLKMREWGVNEFQRSSRRPEFTIEYGKKYIQPAIWKPIVKIDLSPVFTSKLSKNISIKIAGSAGQAVQTAAMFLGGGAILAGLYSTQRNTFPMTQRSGHSTAETILSPKPIEFTGFRSPDHLVITSNEGLKENYKLLPDIPKKSTVYISENLKPELPKIKAKIRSFPSYRTLDLKEITGPIIGLTKLLATRKIYPLEAFREACKRLAPKYVEENIKAINKTLNN